MTTDELYALLAKRYAYPEYALLPQVRNAAGFGASRTADAIAFSLWPSRGLTITAYELKISRGDWLRERKDPAKAEETAKYCHEIFVVTPYGLIEPKELPPTWGLLAANKAGTQLRVGCPAAVLQPDPLDPSFVAAVMKRAWDKKPDMAALDAEYKRGRADGAESAANTVATLQGEIGEFCKQITDFEAASGVRFTMAWDKGDLGRVVAEVLANRNLDPGVQLRRWKTGMQRVMDEIDRALE